tara:strand:- start:373 stop:639 length:267 start_codon:yes stop_codon:yes gene_type:complete
MQATREDTWAFRNQNTIWPWEGFVLGGQAVSKSDPPCASGMSPGAVFVSAILMGQPFFAPKSLLPVRRTLAICPGIQMPADRLHIKKS